jgi:hypothetical protein
LRVFELPSETSELIRRTCVAHFGALTDFMAVPGVLALEKQRFHPRLSCGRTVGALLSGPGTDELIVTNSLNFDPTFFESC